MKIIKSITAILLVLALMLSLSTMQSSKVSDSDDITNSTSIDEVIFPHDEVIKVSITVDVDDYANMNENAMNEESIMADITYNGYEFTSVAIRPKGNSSLKSVVNSGSNRYSFKIDFDDYIDEQSFLGIEKINLNNLFDDPTMMAEYLSYEMLDSIDAVSSRTTYSELYINDEYFGLYLAVEQVEEEFLIENYGSATGELYKPEMGDGADLVYTTEYASSYDGLIAKNIESDNEDIIEFMRRIEYGESVDDIFNVDSYLKYLAMSTLSVHMDSYQGNMFHNYYLYNNDGVFEWISWDLNMTFNGFPMGGFTDEEATALLIYEPVVASMDSYPLVEFILSNDEYIEIYNGYMQELMDGYLSSETFETRILEVYEMINSYVKSDPTSFYSYDEFKESLFMSNDEQLTLSDFMSKRIDNVELQLSGKIASTNDGNGNVGTAEVKMGAGEGPVRDNNGPAINDENIDQNAQNENMPPQDGNEITQGKSNNAET
ncbi:MAG: CotH kinase family protein, partial [Acidaminobacteraceae bacterium]